MNELDHTDKNSVPDLRICRSADFGKWKSIEETPGRQAIV